MKPGAATKSWCSPAMAASAIAPALPRFRSAPICWCERARMPRLCFRAAEGSRRFYGVDKFTPEQVRQEEGQASKATKVFYGGKRRRIRYKETGQRVLAARRQSAARCA